MYTGQSCNCYIDDEMAQDLDTITEQDSLLISNKQLLQQLDDQQAAITSAVERLEQTLEGIWPIDIPYYEYKFFEVYFMGQ